MHLVLCYDVVSDNARQKLYDKLHGFMKPVQKSVFEGQVPPGRYDELLRVVKRTVNLETDNVRIYHLCRGCVNLTDHIGKTEIIGEPEDIIL